MPSAFLFDWPLSGWNKNQSNNSKVEACQEHPTVRGVSMTGETKPPFMREIMRSEKLHASREFFKWKREKIPSQVNWTIFAAYLYFECPPVCGIDGRWWILRRMAFLKSFVVGDKVLVWLVLYYNIQIYLLLTFLTLPALIELSEA